MQLDNLYNEFHNGTLESILNQMETKGIQKSFKLHGFGMPLSNREKLIAQYMRSMDRFWNKGNAFMRCGEGF